MKDSNEDENNEGSGSETLHRPLLPETGTTAVLEATKAADTTTSSRPPGQESLPSDTATIAAVVAEENAGADDDLMDAAATDQLFRTATAITVMSWLLLLWLTYAVTPRDRLVILEGSEREAARAAFFILIISLFLLLLPIALPMGGAPPRQRSSGILLASVTVTLIACCTNALLAFTPTIVMVDPVTKARVFLIRWCEWIPLAGLMTFLSEAVDLPKTKGGLRMPILVPLMQSLSCLCGWVFPYCPDPYTWCLVMSISFVTYFTMFPRVWIKRKKFLSTKQGTSVLDIERYDRVRFAYLLMLVCTVVWTVLVVMYFVNMVAHHTLPVGHWFRVSSLAMITDTLFDVIAKCVYMKVILEVHLAVFDLAGRAQRQLRELKELMSVLWQRSSDVIVISVRNGTRYSSILSPSLITMIGATVPPYVAEMESAVMLLETEFNVEVGGTHEVTAAYYVDASYLPYAGSFRNGVLATLKVSSYHVEKATSIVGLAWQNFLASSGDSAPGLNPAPLILHRFQRAGGDECRCEVKLSRHTENGLIAVMRDVTERYQRFDAERRAHEEALARQREAQAANRFTRHEVKNGLLSGIELCDSIRGSFEKLNKTLQDGASPELTVPLSSLRSGINELDHILHEILDTVLAEAMARDVVHEAYMPRYERVDVPGLLKQSGSDGTESDRFVVECSNDNMPYLLLDPQMIRYIHRNAVSNACKYGKVGGAVVTKVNYNDQSKILKLDVINEPGDYHAKLLAMGEAAAHAVFAQGTRLHDKLDHADSRLSTGDGAWIMRKCAKALGGDCTISFNVDRTVFSFSCPATRVVSKDWSRALDFEVPEGTWGIAVDDSKIQRRLMSRILNLAGVDNSRTVVLGRTLAEVQGLNEVVNRLVNDYPDNKILLLMDENLEYGDKDESHVVFSGSIILQNMLAKLNMEQESRILALMRSANDSPEDLSLYATRSHGYFPKAPMQRDQVCQVLASLWASRFHTTQEVKAEEVVGLDESNEFTREDFQALVDDVNAVLKVSIGDEKQVAASSWPTLWGALHTLKGDLMVLEGRGVHEVVAAINSLRGQQPPTDLVSKWDVIQKSIADLIGCLPSRSTE